MPAIDVTEYSHLPADENGRALVVGKEPAELNQQLPVAGFSAQSAPFGATTRFIRLHTDATCRVAFGQNPTASTASMRVPANATEYFGVIPGQRVAVISST